MKNTSKATKATRWMAVQTGATVTTFLARGGRWVRDGEFVDFRAARMALGHDRHVEVFSKAPASETAKARASRIANEAGGYSSDRFASWDAVAAMLCRRGYSDREAVAIMVSKWTRWACDSDEDHAYGHHTAATLARFLDAGAEGPDGLATPDHVEALTRETFGDEPGPDWR